VLVLFAAYPNPKDASIYMVPTSIQQCWVTVPRAKVLNREQYCDNHFGSCMIASKIPDSPITDRITCNNIFHISQRDGLGADLMLLVPSLSSHPSRPSGCIYGLCRRTGSASVPQTADQPVLILENGKHT